jgi:hypothetical protein
MRTIPTIAAVLVMASSLALCSSEASAETVRRFCDAGGSCFVCTRGQPTCEIAYALSRATTPPSATPNMNEILPPSPAPSPGRMYPERAYGAVPPSKNTMPPPMHSPLSREAERENIIRQGEAFCAKYPDDKVCHPAPETPAPQ